jgi:DNA-directed RNA polymerase subunit beta'
MANVSLFDKIKIGIASPEDIDSWSHGEVKKPETINYRTFKPERDGLFCERIFGPVKDWECHCGRYKKVKYKGVTCERCGVEVTRQKVRRERMGHIELAAPVCHIWYLKGVPSPLSLILDISPRLLEKVCYFASFIVIDIDNEGIEENMSALTQAIEEEKHAIAEGAEQMEEMIREQFAEELAENKDVYDEQHIKERTKAINDRIKAEYRESEDRAQELDAALELLTKLERRQLIDEDRYRAVDRMLEVASRRIGKDLSSLLRAGIGAAAIRDLLSQVDLERLARELRHEIVSTSGPRRARAIKRLEIAEALHKSRSRPEWMVLTNVPVISPELRPMVQLDGGRFATSDLNDLYRRIINRNNRLKKIIDIRAPESIINHEKRLLQEAVDALIDNGRRTRPVVGSNNRPLKSLSDMLKGKEGRFRKNLLGKRVDYSGRSVIVVGPHLNLNQCGLPKEMALELFKPLVMKTLVERRVTQNIKSAKRLIDRMHPSVWDSLEEVIAEHPVLLNRAPTLHRLGIQAFQPVLVDGKAIQVHPMVCHAYAADFDGDQMAVHIPLSANAQAEARVLMLSTNNLFSPANGRPIVSPIQDIVLGCYYATMVDEKSDPGKTVYANPGEVECLLELGHLRLHQRIKVRVRPPGLEDKVIVETTPGRLWFNSLLPPQMRYDAKYLNLLLSKKAIAEVVNDCHRMAGPEATIRLLDSIKTIGFRAATEGAITISMTDMDPPEQRDSIISRTEREVENVNRQYDRGMMNAQERRERVLKHWTMATEEVGKAIVETFDQFNPLSIVTDSGARGSVKQLTQLAGMRGLMADPFGNIVEDLPIRSNFHEGLSVFEYFVSTHGARKGLADTALRTADAGYLTRRLVDVSQDVIIREEDCGTLEGISVGWIIKEGDVIETLEERIAGRTALVDIRDPKTKEVLVEADTIITDENAARIAEIEERYRDDLRHSLEKGSRSLKLLENKYRSAGFDIGDRRQLMVFIRSPLTCELEQGICAKCYGRDLATGREIEIGSAVGIIAAQSIGEPGTQLTMRTFHTGGIAGQHITGVKDVKRQRGASLREIMSDQDLGLLQFSGEEILDLRSEQQRILSEVVASSGGDGKPKKGARRKSRSKKHDEPLEFMSEEKLHKHTKSWTQQLVKLLESEISGINRVEELFEARHPKGEAIISDIGGLVTKIQRGNRGRWVVIEGEVNVAERSPTSKFAATDIVNPNTGDVEAEAGTELTDRLIVKLRTAGVTNTKVIDLVLVPYRGTLEVAQGQELRPSDRITPGPLDPHKVLTLRGVRGVQDYLVREIQSVYKAQGVDINDKHIEIITRQMLRKRKIHEPGDTAFLPGQIVDRFVLKRENDRIRSMIERGVKFKYVDPETHDEKERDPKEATATWVLLGITEASLATDSFLSAASFQKTTRVLTEAAVKGKQDELVGLKENVIIGRLIPAGTGFPRYRRLDIDVDKAPEWAERSLTALVEPALAAEQLGDDLGEMARGLTLSELADSEADEGDEFGAAVDVDMPLSQMAGSQPPPAEGEEEPEAEIGTANPGAGEEES